MITFKTRVLEYIEAEQAKVSRHLAKKDAASYFSALDTMLFLKNHIEKMEEDTIQTYCSHERAESKSWPCPVCGIS